LPEIKLKFTKHAKEIIAKREISESLILNVVKSPDMIFLDRRSSLMVAIKKNKQALVVLYDPEDENLRIVTAFKTSKLVKLIKNKLDKGYWVKVG
jgi:hypothetical protein